MRVFAITARDCMSTLAGFSFGRSGPLDLHFAMPAEEFQEAVSLVAIALLEEGIVPDKLVRTHGR